MRKYTFLNALAMAGLVIGFAMMTSCEGPQGPEGPAGPAGPEGPKGDDGTPGVAGTAVCLECHNLEAKAAVEEDYETSGHAAGNAVGYAGNRVDCASCHSNEGFLFFEKSGNRDLAEGTIINGTRISCMTCHDFHETLDFENEGPDYAVRKNDPVTLLIDGTELDLGDNSNLCANCHQPRSGPNLSDGANTEITYFRYGPHHGPQATMLEGVGGAEVEGSTSYPTGQSTHRSEGSCTICHQAEGSHTFNPSVAVCASCHDGAEDFNINNFQTDIEGLLETLKGELETAGMIDADGYAVEGTYPTDQVGAFYNYKLVLEDRSLGIHNPGYAEALLRNSIEAF